MSTSLSSLRTKVLQYCNESAATVYGSQTVVDMYINDAQQDVALWLSELSPSYLTSSSTITRVNGTLNYTLPTGFLSLKSLIDSNDNILIKIHPLERDYKSGYYFHSATEIAIAPNTVSESVTIEYTALPSDLVNATSNMGVPDFCGSLVALNAAFKLKDITQEFEAAQMLQRRFEEKKIKIRDNIIGRDRASRRGRIRNIRTFDGIPTY